MLTATALVTALSPAPLQPIRPQLCPERRILAPRMGAMQDAEKWITENVGSITKTSGMGGGSGWASLSRYSVEGSRCDLVVKASSSRPLESMFLGEALGLKALGASGSMAIPEVFAFEDAFSGGSYLIIEYMEMSGRADPELFGRKMAEMHLAEPLDAEAKSGRFGFRVDNTIGGTPQPNVRKTTATRPSNLKLPGRSPRLRCHAPVGVDGG